MDSSAYLILAALAAVPLLIILHRRKMDLLEAEKKVLAAKLPGGTRRFFGADMTSALGIDESKRLIALVNKGEPAARVYPFADIISAEITEDGATITKTSSSRSIPGAIIGAAIAGPAGLIVGGLGGSSTGRELRRVSAIEVVVMLADLASPRFCLRVLDAPHGLACEGEDYKASRREADILLSVLKSAMELAARAEAGQGGGAKAPARKGKPASVADELEKLAALRDKGVLTEEEFQNQKRAMLGASV